MKQKKLGSFLKNNLIFILITVIVGLAALIIGLFSYFREPFYSEKYIPDSYVIGSFSDNASAVVINGGSEIAVLDQKQRLLYKIKGGSEERAFTTAFWIYIQDENTIYVADRVKDDSDIYINKERIIKITNHGNTHEVLYETEHTGEQATRFPVLFDPLVYQDTLYFSEASSEGITVYRADEEGDRIKAGFLDLTEQAAVMDHPEKLVIDTDFCIRDGSISIAAVLMDSNVYLSENNSPPVLIYEASGYETEDYISIINDVDFDDAGRLYLTDIGLRKVVCYEVGAVSDVITPNHFEREIADGFAYLPLYSGVNITGQTITLVASEYIYSEEVDDFENSYILYSVDTDGSLVCSLEEIPISASFRFKCILLYLSIFFLVILGVYAIIQVAGVFLKTQTGNVGTQIMVLITALVVTIFVSYFIFNSSKSRYMTKSMENLTNIGFLIEAKINKEYLASIDSPECYRDPAYAELNHTINVIIHDNVNFDENAYAILYGIKDNIIYEVYRDDMLHEIMTPVEGGFKGTWEQGILESGQYDFSESENISEGSFVYVMIPIYDVKGEPLSLLEVGMNYNSYEKTNSNDYHTMLVLISSVVIIVMLFLSEFMNAVVSIRHQSNHYKKKESYSPTALRPIAFLVFFTANIPTAFLPIYGTTLWTEDFPFPAEIGAAIPLSVAFIAAALTSFAAGYLVKKIGITPLCIAGALLYAAGNLFCATASNLWILILANAVSASGDGLFIMGINYRISGFPTENEQNKGFVGYNGAYLSGMNCGMVIGALVCDQFGYPTAFYFGAGCAALIIVAVLFLMDHKKVKVAEEEDPETSVTKKASTFRRFFTPGMIKYLLFISVPYTICEAFLNYFYPILAEENMMTVSEISLAFLISGTISIYTGSAFGEYITDFLGARKSMLLASFIYAAALLCFILNPSLQSCYIVIVMFAVADSFGLAANSVYFTTRPESLAVGQNKAIAINETLTSIVSATGSVVFGGALLLGARRGIMLITGVFIVLLMLFIILDRSDKKEECVYE